MKKFKAYLKENYKSLILKLVLLALLLTADLVTKEYFSKPDAPKEFIPNIISFTFVKNEGAAFGIFPNGSIWLAVVSIIFLIVFVLYDLGNKEQNIFSKLGFVFIFAGAIGNMIDRFALNYVRDFIQFDFVEFPVFNIADVCITIGCGLYIIYLIIYLFAVKKSKKKTIKNENLSETIQSKEETEKEDK